MDKVYTITKGNNMTTEDDIKFVNEVLAEENCISTNKEFVMLFDDCGNGQLLRAFMLSELINRFKKITTKNSNAQIKSLKSFFTFLCTKLKERKQI